MATYTTTATDVANAVEDAVSSARSTLKPSGALDRFEHFDITPVIGREYPTVNLKELIEAPDSDDLLRDLAVTSKSLLACSDESGLTSDCLSPRCSLLPEAGRPQQRLTKGACSKTWGALRQAKYFEVAHPSGI
jgi:hypothetical protein